MLWIDRISIHQDDTKEKERQVKLMANIYGSASLVLVWLGPDPDDVCVAFGLMPWITIHALQVLQQGSQS